MTAAPELRKRSKDQKDQLIELKEVISYHLETLKSDYSKMTTLLNQATDIEVFKTLDSYLTKQEKLIEIATELKNRINAMRFIVKHQSQSERLVQIMIETDLLAEMHFRVKKSYFKLLREQPTIPAKQGLMVA